MMSTNEEMLKKIDPLHYFEQFILEEVYPDGRDITQFRPTTIEVSVDAAAYGSAYVKQSGACVSCIVKLSVAPDSDQPSVTYELKALECIPREIVEETNTHLSRVIRDEYLLDPNLLLICVSKDSFDLRYTLHLEIVAMSFDGSLTDAVLTSVQAALRNTRLPHVSYTGKAMLSDETDDIPLQFDVSNLRIHPLADGEHPCRRVDLKDILVNTSFLLYNSPKLRKKTKCQLLCDASAELCAIIPGRCQIIVGGDDGKTIYALSFSTPEGVRVDDLALAEIVETARRRHAAISSAIERCTK